MERLTGQHGIISLRAVIACPKSSAGISIIIPEGNVILGMAGYEVAGGTDVFVGEAEDRLKLLCGAGSCGAARMGMLFFIELFFSSSRRKRASVGSTMPAALMASSAGTPLSIVCNNLF